MFYVISCCVRFHNPQSTRILSPYLVDILNVNFFFRHGTRFVAASRIEILALSIERIGIMVWEMAMKAKKVKRNPSNTEIHFSVTKGTAKAID